MVYQFGLAYADQLRDARNGVRGLLVLPHGFAAGDGLNAAYAGGNAAFARDFKQPDIARARDVRAAAQFAAEDASGAGDADDAHLVAVLLAEQSHGAGGDGFIDGQNIGRDAGVGQYLFVHDALDLADFGGIDGGIMREIET